MGFLTREVGGQPDIGGFYAYHGMKRPYVEVGDGYYAQAMTRGVPGKTVRVAGLTESFNIRDEFSQCKSQGEELMKLANTVLIGKWILFDRLVLESVTHQDFCVNWTSVLHLLTLMGCLKWHYPCTPVERELFRMVILDTYPCVGTYEGRDDRDTWLFDLNNFCLKSLAEVSW
jgi:hypothetical protein